MQELSPVLTNLYKYSGSSIGRNFSLFQKICTDYPNDALFLKEILRNQNLSTDLNETIRLLGWARFIELVTEFYLEKDLYKNLRFQCDKGLPDFYKKWSERMRQVSPLGNYSSSLLICYAMLGRRTKDFDDRFEKALSSLRKYPAKLERMDLGILYLCYLPDISENVSLSDNILSLLPFDPFRGQERGRDWFQELMCYSYFTNSPNFLDMAVL